MNPGPSLTPFRAEIPESVLEDLQHRLSRARWPVAPEGDPWFFGTSPPYLKQLLDHWQTGFDWRSWERRINAHEQYLVESGDLSTHVVVVRSENPDALPLLITHGWPGSIVEYLDMAEMLAQPERHGGRAEDAFTVVLPSLPGYGFSGAPKAPVSPRDIAPVWHAIMTGALGFTRYGAHGGDWGALVTGWLGLAAPAGLVAIHQTAGYPLAQWTFADDPATPEETAHIVATQSKTARETGYQAIQGTKPLTLSYALTDSPIGLAAWIAEKFHGWTDRHGGVDPVIPLDALIANIMMHWIPGPGPATWMYAFLLDGSAMAFPDGQRVTLPTGICSFPEDFGTPAPDSLIRRSFNMTHRTMASAGGHFPGLERPEELASDLRKFFADYR